MDFFKEHGHLELLKVFGLALRFIAGSNRIFQIREPLENHHAKSPKTNSQSAVCEVTRLAFLEGLSQNPTGIGIMLH
jgi:hypothetical protein